MNMNETDNEKIKTMQYFSLYNVIQLRIEFIAIVKFYLFYCDCSLGKTLDELVH